MSSRAGTASVGVSALGAIGVVVDLVNITAVVGGPNAGVSDLIVPMYAVADAVGITTASVVAAMNRDRPTLAPVALFLCSAPVLAFYIFLVVDKPEVAAGRAQTALSFLGDVFGSVGDFLVFLLT